MINIELYPGQAIVVSTTTVGAQNGTVPGGIHADIAHLTIKLFQVTQGVTTYRKCADLQFTAHSSAEFAIIKLRPETSLQIHTNSRMPVKLHLNFKVCPPGFILSTEIDHSVTAVVTHSNKLGSRVTLAAILCSDQQEYGLAMSTIQ